MGFFMVKYKLLLITVFLFTLSSLPVEAVESSLSKIQEPVRVDSISPKEMDVRAKVLAAYFAKFNSPLEYHAQDFIDAADQYGVNWRLVPAIAGVESTFGKHIPGGYNAYGWAIFTSDSRYGFQSWRHGIFTVTEGLKKNYIDQGLTDPYSMNKKYAASKAWGWKVDFFMKDLEKFEKEYHQRLALAQ